MTMARGQGDGAPVQPEARGSRVPLVLSLFVVAALVGGYFWYPPFHDQVNTAWQILRSDDRQRVSTWVGQFGLWGPVVIIAAMTAQMFLIVIPSVLLMAVAVLAYGPWSGTLLAVAAVLVASSVGYALGRMLGAGRLQRLLGARKVERLQAAVDDYGFWGVVVFRLSPFLSNDAISFVGGVVQMRYTTFMLATTVGIAPLAVVIGFGQSTDHMQDIFAWVSVAGLILLAGFIVVDRRRGPADR